MPAEGWPGRLATLNCDYRQAKWKLLNEHSQSFSRGVSGQLGHLSVFRAQLECAQKTVALYKRPQ